MKKANSMLSDRELSDFCDQLAMILESGISLSEGLDMILEDAQSEEEKKIMEDLKNGLEQSGIFCDALQEAGVFPSYMVEMVRIGEETGHLDDVMQSLTEHYDRSDSIHQSIRSAIFYPAMMFCMMILIVVILLTNVMPIFNQVFLQMGTELTGVSRVLLNVGSVIKNYAVVLVCIAAVLAAAAAVVARWSKARAWFIRVISGIPSVRRMYDTLFQFRFTSGMTLALSSGMDMENALDMIKKLTDDPVSVQRLDRCKELMDAGKDLPQALNETKILTGVYSRMTAIGQKTGTMEHVMSQIALGSQEEFDQKTSRMLALIEPTLVIVLSVIVGIILMSVMFPLLGILSGM